MTTEGALSYLVRDAQARVRTDKVLAAAGRVVESCGAANLTLAYGLAVREFLLSSSGEERRSDIGRRVVPDDFPNTLKCARTV